MLRYATSVKLKVSAILFLEENSIRFLRVVSALPLYPSIVRKFIVGECKDIYNRFITMFISVCLTFLGRTVKSTLMKTIFHYTN